MSESFFPAIPTYETSLATGFGASLEPTVDTVQLRIAPAGVSVRGRFWREGPILKAVVHVQTAGAAPKTISAEVDLRPIMRAVHAWYRRKHGVHIGGFPGSFFKAVKKVGKSKLLGSVSKAVKSVVQSKLTGAAIGAAAVVFPPVGLPAAAAYATANAALAALDKANAVKNEARTVLTSGTAAEKMLLRAKAPQIADTLRKAAVVRNKLREITQRAQRGDIAARKTASIFAHVVAHRGRVQSLAGKAKVKDWMPGLLVTQYGKIVPGHWLHAQSAANAVALAPVSARSFALNQVRRRRP
ncbi:MAG: hypothetical protein ABIQ16_05950 [Polyangiaceae bacterium]